MACLTTKLGGNPMGYVNADGREAIVAVSAAGHVMQIVRTPTGLVTTDLTQISRSAVIAAGDAWGYLRSDGFDAVVFRAIDGTIHDMGENVGWGASRLTAPSTEAPRAHPDATIMAYVRTDGRNAVVYRGEDNHLWELASDFGHAPPWLVGDLTLFLGTPDLVGNPIGYVRSDDRNAMVYRAADGHLHQISSNFGTATPWMDTDLTTDSGQTVLPSADPWAYRRQDGKSAVVYLGADGQLHELTQVAKEPWAHQLLPAVSPAGVPRAFIRSDGKASVVYRSNDVAPGSVHELVLGGDWTDRSLDALEQPPAGPAGVPFAFQGAQGVDSIVYRSLTGELFERRLDFSGSWRLVTY